MFVKAVFSMIYIKLTKFSSPVSAIFKNNFPKILSLPIFKRTEIEKSMKNILIIILIIVAAYFLYTRFLAPPTRTAAKRAEEKMFGKPYSQTIAAKQSEAKLLAAALVNKQNTYYSIHGRFAGDIKELGSIPRFGKHYKAKIIRADENDFLIEIRGNIDSDPTEDVWEATKDGYKNVVNDIIR